MESKLVFAAALDGETHLWIGRVDSVRPDRYPGPPVPLGHSGRPTAAPWRFTQTACSNVIDIDGGLVRTLTASSRDGGGTWNGRGRRFSSSPTRPVRSCASPRRGRSAAEVTRLEARAWRSQPSHFLPDGRHFRTSWQGSSEARGVYLGQLDGPDGRRLFDSDSAAVYASGHLLFVRKTTVYASPV